MPVPTLMGFAEISLIRRTWLPNWVSRRAVAWRVIYSWVISRLPSSRTAPMGVGFSYRYISRAFGRMAAKKIKDEAEIAKTMPIKAETTRKCGILRACKYPRFIPLPILAKKSRTVKVQSLRGFFLRRLLGGAYLLAAFAGGRLAGRLWGVVRLRAVVLIGGRTGDLVCLSLSLSINFTSIRWVLGKIDCIAIFQHVGQAHG